MTPLRQFTSERLLYILRIMLKCKKYYIRACSLGRLKSSADSRFSGLFRNGERSRPGYFYQAGLDLLFHCKSGWSYVSGWRPSQMHLGGAINSKIERRIQARKAPGSRFRRGRQIHLLKTRLISGDISSIDADICLQRDGIAGTQPRQCPAFKAKDKPSQRAGAALASLDPSGLFGPAFVLVLRGCRQRFCRLFLPCMLLGPFVRTLWRVIERIL